MTTPQKPEKYVHKEKLPAMHFDYGYNKAIDDYDQYHRHVVGELTQEVQSFLDDMESVCQHLGQSDTSVKLYGLWIRLDKALAKHRESEK